MRWRGGHGLGWLEAQLGPGARAAFSTRAGGTSEPPFRSLNLGIATDDVPERVLANRRRLCSALGLDPSGVAMARQVHGSELIVHGERPRDNTFATGRLAGIEADGHATAGTDVALAVLVADCLPVAVVGEQGLAMLHCGWRGLAQGIIERGVEAVGGTAAAIGPGIGPCCYEVGPEVLEAFASRGHDPGTGPALDLERLAIAELERAGVSDVVSSGLCTSCEVELFYSHRRDGGRTGRQAGIAWLSAS